MNKNRNIMKNILSLIILSSVALHASAQSTQKVVAQSESHSAEYTLKPSARLVIGDTKLVLTDGKTEASFSPDERVVLFVKKNDTTTSVQGDVNGDTQVTISDVTKLVDILLEKKD